MKEYLVNTIGIKKLQAFVMPENIYSTKVLLRNGFMKEDHMVQVKDWAGQEFVLVNVYTFLSDQ